MKSFKNKKSLEAFLESQKDKVNDYWFEPMEFKFDRDYECMESVWINLKRPYIFISSETSSEYFHNVSTAKKAFKDGLLKEVK